MEEENLVPGTEGVLFETTITWDAPVENDNTIRAYHDPVDTNRIARNDNDEIYIGYADRLAETPLAPEDVIEAPQVANGTTTTLEMRDEVPTGQFDAHWTEVHPNNNGRGIWHQIRENTQNNTGITTDDLGRILNPPITTDHIEEHMNYLREVARESGMLPITPTATPITENGENLGGQIRRGRIMSASNLRNTNEENPREGFLILDEQERRLQESQRVEQTQEQHETLAQQSINHQIRIINEEAQRAEQRARDHVQRITREHLERTMGEVFRTDRNVNVAESKNSSKNLMNHLMPFLEELKKEGRLDVDTYNDIYIKMDEYVRGV